MWSDPVTFGGGMTIEKIRSVSAWLSIDAIQTGINPPLSPVRFKALGLVHFLELHH